MVSHDTEVTCPECDHEFAIKDVAVWHVCLTCGKIWPPGEEWSSHNWNDDVECDGVHAVMKYSEEAAEQQSEEVQTDAEVPIP